MNLQILIDKARNRGLWLRCFYQDLWFSPDELEAKNKEGKFLWDPVSWELRDPKERIKTMERQINLSIDRLTEFRRRVTK